MFEKIKNYKEALQCFRRGEAYRRGQSYHNWLDKLFTFTCLEINAIIVRTFIVE